jgi:hypothetical protein
LRELIVGDDRETGPRARERAFGGIRRRTNERSANLFERSPLEASFAGSNWTRMAGFCSPPMETWATPGTCAICWARKLSAYSLTTVIGSVSERTDNVRIAAWAGLTFL